MRQSHKVCMGAVLMALTGYGLWSLYRKYYPDYMCEMERAYKNISKDVEKSIDDMM